MNRDIQVPSIRVRSIRVRSISIRGLRIGRIRIGRASIATGIIVLALMVCHVRAVEAAAPSDAATSAETAAAPTDSPAASADSPSAPSQFSAAGLYNLANSYARAGKPGMAVLNYERASLLAPNDPDIEANLRFVRNSVNLPPDAPSRFERAATLASPEWLAWTGVLGVLLAGASLLAGRRYPRRRWLRRAGAVLGIALMGLTVCNGVVLWPTLHAAVVITAATPVRVSPVPMGDPLFTLPEAETVRMTAEHEGFVLVQTRAGSTGWVARANLAPVVPRGSPDAVSFDR